MVKKLFVCLSTRACGSRCTKMFYACWLIHSNKVKTTVTSISNDKKCTPHRSQLHSLILIYKLYIEKKMYLEENSPIDSQKET